MSQYEPPPIDFDNLPPDFYDAPPPDMYDYVPEYDPYPPEYHEPLPIPDDYVPQDMSSLPDMPPPEQDGLQGFEQAEPLDESWSWHDARLIGVDRGEEADDERYEIGAIDLYRDAATGDLGGSYLPVASFAEEASATAYFHDLEAELHEAAVTVHDVPRFAQDKAFEMQPEPQNWRGATPDEYAAYDYIRSLESFEPDLADEPPLEAIDPLLQTAIELGGVEVIEDDIALDVDVPDKTDPTRQALEDIGVAADNFDPQHNPPPFYDADTGISYWIGVFQPDNDDRENCVTSILSLGRDPETGEMEAQLAPCVPGDWDKTYAAAEYLIEVAQRGGIEQVFDTAEGMALATDQRELWQTGRGVPIEDADLFIEEAGTPDVEVSL